MFVVYAFDDLEEKQQKTHKSKQRWEQCVDFVAKIFGPALHSLYALKYFNLEVQKSAKNFTKEAVEEYIKNIIEIDSEDFTFEVKRDLIEKLNSTDYIIGYSDEVLNLKKIEELYDDLDLNETEALVETYQKLEFYDQKIGNLPYSNWKKKLHVQSREKEIKYFTDDNILCKFNHNIIKFKQLFLLFSFRCSSSFVTLSLLSSKSFSIFQHSFSVS